MASTATKTKTKTATSLTKSALIDRDAERSGLTKTEARSALDALTAVVTAELKAGNAVMLHGLLKIKAVVKPATAEHEGFDPFTKQPKVFKAKPAKTVVKATALKTLRDQV